VIEHSSSGAQSAIAATDSAPSGAGADRVVWGLASGLHSS
jgi:hypothetical protein